MTRNSASSHELARQAAAVLQPGFEGTTPPDWVRHRLAEGLGGVALFGRNIEERDQVATLTGALKAERPDVLIAIDEESGDVTRLDVRAGSSRPGNLALGVADDPALTEEVARDLGRDLAGVGVNLDYAPDADVNSNPDNPVIGVRSFGADPELVARHTVAWVRGLQEPGVAACAKHFPGHGDTAVDSHHDTPVVRASRDELAATALVPFRAAIGAGVRAIMSAHLVVPAYDREVPASLSRRVLTGLLREELGFEGLIVTDAVEMAGVSTRYGLPGAAVRAIAAGADAICVGGEHADAATADHLRDALVRAVVEGMLPEERLAAAARRVGELAAWTLSAARNAHDPTGDTTTAASGDATPVGLTAARRALRLTVGPDARALPLAGAAHVVEFAPGLNLAVGRQTPWGLAEPLRALVPETTSVRLGPADVDSDGWFAASVAGPAAGRSLVLVTRDAHRHPWMAEALRRALAARPDSVVVEMGLPGETRPGAIHLATHGAARVCGIAAAEVLAGHTGALGS